jgi:hypothetical protein
MILQPIIGVLRYATMASEPRCCFPRPSGPPRARETIDGDGEGWARYWGGRGSIVVGGEQEVEMPRRCKDDASPSATYVRQRFPLQREL